MFSRRTVMLFVNMSSVMMVTRRVQRAETWCSPSEKTQRYIERLEISCLNWIEWHSSGWQVVSLHSCEWDELWEHAGTWSLISVIVHQAFRPSQCYDPFFTLFEQQYNQLPVKQFINCEHKNTILGKVWCRDVLNIFCNFFFTRKIWTYYSYTYLILRIYF